MMMRRKLLITFIAGVVGVGWLIGATNLPGSWYAALQKPPFNPPNWVFAPTWTLLYIMIAIAGWRTYLHDAKSYAMQLWLAQMVLNFAWSPTVFTLHSLTLGLAIIVMLLTMIVTFIVIQWPIDRQAALLFIPYAAWVGFASVLNYELFRLN